MAGIGLEIAKWHKALHGAMEIRQDNDFENGLTHIDFPLPICLSYQPRL